MPATQPNDAANVTYVVTLVTSGYLGPLDITQRGIYTLEKVSDYLRRVASGNAPANTTVDMQDGTTTLVQASGTLTLATATGTVGGTIGGTLVTVTASGGDTATATALAAAINANTTVNKWVAATSVAAVVTLKVLSGGAVGNNVTLAASGTGVTASGAKLTGGVNATANAITY